jgi:hypothetical protein
VKTLRLDDVEGIPVFGSLVWKPVRRQLGVTAFGINAYTAAAAGDEVVEDHDETSLGHEEIYLVVSGHAIFTVDGEEVDAPAGTLVFLDDPAQRRSAVARDAGTTVLAIGGVPGRHEVSAWEYLFATLPYRDAGDYETARRMLEDDVAEHPDLPALRYHLACIEALCGNRERALDELTAAVAAGDRFRERARTDEDFDSLRDDPRFPV